MSRLETYRAVTQGLTQADTSFRDAVEALDYEIKTDFYNSKRNTINRLNQRTVGIVPNNEKPVDIVGLVDFRQKKITLNELSGEETYNLDDFDPRYLRVLNQNVHGSERNPDELPLSKLSVELLDAQVNEPTNALPFNNIEDKYDLTSTRRQLEQAFANEMVLLVELDEFVKDNGLESVFEAHKDELIQLVDKKAFAQSFNDAVVDLGRSAEHILGA